MDKEYSWLEKLLEETHERMESLQQMYQKLTGKRWIPWRAKCQNSQNA